MTASITTVPPGRAIDQQRFERLAGVWKSRSRYMSNPAQIAMLPEYQRIIGMGETAVPFILKEMRREPDQWFWALAAITEEDPIPEEAKGDVERMTQAWVDWGIQKGLIAA